MSTRINQITVYLSEEVEAGLKASAEKLHLSLSKYVAMELEKLTLGKPTPSGWGAEQVLPRPEVIVTPKKGTEPLRSEKFDLKSIQSKKSAAEAALAGDTSAFPVGLSKKKQTRSFKK